MISEQTQRLVLTVPLYERLAKINYSCDIAKYVDCLNDQCIRVPRLRHLYHYTKSRRILKQFVAKANPRDLLYIAKVEGHIDLVIKKFIEKDNPEQFVRYCTFIGDHPLIRRALARHINDPEHLYRYCRRVKDHPLVWKALLKSRHPDAYEWQYQYYCNVEPRREMLDVLLRNYNAMKLLTEYCIEQGKDIPIIRTALVKHRHYRAIYYYCRDVKDSKSLWKQLQYCQDPDILYDYLKNVKVRPELVKALAKLKDKSPSYLLSYLTDVEDNEVIWKALAKSKHPTAAEYKAKYCVRVKDRPEMWKALLKHAKKDALWLIYYCQQVKDREEIWKELIRVKSPATSLGIVRYCQWIKDREELWKELASRPRAAWEQALYLTDVKYRQEMVEAISSSKSAHKETTIMNLRKHGIVILEDVYDYRSQPCMQYSGLY